MHWDEATAISSPPFSIDLKCTELDGAIAKF